ncbi:Cytochrome c oxidase subunit 2 precursor [Aeoliella mucimassa]|uniref:Cytochrome c oxidase subunit 2 n=2 Tax=Aeoliella mucimassa TaxID=2527972 RepID=A0A518AH06_9BACT|nr:Cytochrome c oxidase subunit 2 precursor [Aeoliella mucimassa]
MGNSPTTTGQHVDFVYDVVTWISIFFFVLVVTLMVTFVVKYRARPGHTEQPSPSHNNALEIIWSVIPVLLLALIFFMSFTLFMDMRTPPADAYEIRVVASKWNFNFVYPNGASSDVLHVPPNRPIRLKQESRDVIHSLYIPAFRAKMDCVPGRYTYQWFEATEPGSYDLFCAEYCGRDHSNMNSIVVVHQDDAAFQEQLNKLSTPPAYPPDWGKELWAKKGCKACHTDDGSSIAGGGPSWKDVYDPAKPKTFVGGDSIDPSDIPAMDNYVMESIRKPQAKIRAGYESVKMSAYPPSLVSNEEVNAITAYMKELAGKYDGPSREEAEAAAEAAENGEQDASTDTAETDSPETDKPETDAPEAGDQQ